MTYIKNKPFTSHFVGVLRRLYHAEFDSRLSNKKKTTKSSGPEFLTKSSNDVYREAFRDNIFNKLFKNKKISCVYITISFYCNTYSCHATMKQKIKIIIKSNWMVPVITPINLSG